MLVRGRSVVLQSLTRTVAGAPPGRTVTPFSGWSWERLMRLPFACSPSVSAGQSFAWKASRPGGGPPLSAAAGDSLASGAPDGLSQPVTSSADAARTTGTTGTTPNRRLCLLTVTSLARDLCRS